MTLTTVRHPMVACGSKGIVLFASRAGDRGTIIIRGIFVLPHAITPGPAGEGTTSAFGLRGQSNPYRGQHPYREQRPSREQRERREIEPKQPSRERPESRAP